VKWNYLEEKDRKYLHDFYGALIKFRTEHDVFETTNFALYTASSLKRITLNSEEMNVVILGNFGLTAGTMQVTFPGLATYYNYFTGDSLIVDDVIEAIELRPGEYRLYTSVRLEPPQIGTGIWDGETGGWEGFEMRIYPNPASRMLNFEFLILNSGISSKIKSPMLEIIDQYGRTVGFYSLPSLREDFQLDISSWASGIYFARLSDESGAIASGIFMKMQ
jgi:hypothetical protein